jgi:hypothetical protein
MYTEYEIYDILLEDQEDEIYCVSLVKSPAIRSNYIALSEESVIKLAVESEAKRIVTGPVLIPEKLIYREDDKGGYYIKFSADTIEKLRNKFHLKGYTNKTNINHNGIDINSNYTIESYLISENVKDNRFDLPIGTWLMSYKIEDDNTWELTKQGKLQGFSIEAFVTPKKSKSMTQKLSELVNSLTNLLKSNPKEIEDIKLDDSSLISEIVLAEEAISVEDPIEETPTEEPAEIEEDSQELKDQATIMAMESTIMELNTSLEVLRTENETLKSELSKQKDYSAINLSRTSNGSSVGIESKNNLFNLTKNYLKNAH